MTFLPTELTVGNQTLYIEVTDAGPPEEAGPTTAGVSPAEYMGRLESAGAAAGEVCVALYHKLNSAIIQVRPDEVKIEFGISLGGGAGVPFVAHGKAEATFKISATWKPEEAGS